MAQRNTVQLSIVEQALHELANHPTAEQVYLHVHKSYPTIGKATVYRALNKLASTGRAGKVLVTSGADRFDHLTFGHYHVRCTTCGRVDDVSVLLPEDLDQQAAASSGFQIDARTLLFDGLCPGCVKAAKKEGCCA